MLGKLGECLRTASYIAGKAADVYRFSQAVSRAGANGRIVVTTEDGNFLSYRTGDGPAALMREMTEGGSVDLQVRTEGGDILYRRKTSLHAWK